MIVEDDHGTKAKGVRHAQGSAATLDLFQLS